MYKESISFYLDKELQKITSPDATRFLLQQWYIKMFPYIPFRTGTLASTSDIAMNKKMENKTPEQAMLEGLENIDQTIHFKAPYASNMYYGDGFNFSKDQHPLAQARWAEVAADLYGEELSRELAEFLERNNKL